MVQQRAVPESDEKLDKIEKPLSILELYSAGLMNFTVPENTRFVVDGERATGCNKNHIPECEVYDSDCKCTACDSQYLLYKGGCAYPRMM
jgi:hypothetical protein